MTWKIYVEQVQLAGMEDRTPFMVMFAAFFCLAIGCTIDGYQEIKAAVSEAPPAG
ncbi:MAG TPA: hypothetical protein QGF58_25320 [Myxococcota bacterium]|nr:hypothetical protein [Myxococcota bacterium]